MTRQTYSITLEYQKLTPEGVEESITEHYPSIFACAKHYGTNPNAISQYLSGKPFTNTPIPKGSHMTALMSQPKGHLTEGKMMFHCVECDRDYQLANRSNHLISKKHASAQKDLVASPLKETVTIIPNGVNSKKF